MKIYDILERFIMEDIVKWGLVIIILVICPLGYVLILKAAIEYFKDKELFK